MKTVISLAFTFFIILPVISFGEPIRLRGKIFFQDVKRELTEPEARAEIASDSDAKIMIDNFSPKMYFPVSSVSPTIYSDYQIVGESTEQEESYVYVDGKVGRFVNPDNPICIHCEQGGCEKKNILLRSKENASSFVFSKCIDMLNDSTNFNDVILCLSKASNYFNSKVIQHQLGDIYSKMNNYDGCISSFSEIISIINSLPDAINYTDLKEEAILAVAICMEKKNLTINDSNEWRKIADYAFSSFTDGLTRKSSRSQMARIWFDAFLKYISKSSDLIFVSNQIYNDDVLLNEWVALYYRHYFWGKRKPTIYKAPQILLDLKELSAQYSRTYK
jgi:hypothetical protein